MLERRIATYDKTNFRKRLNEFLEVAKIYKQDDLNEHNIYQVLYRTELFRNAIYKCIKTIAVKPDIDKNHCIFKIYYV